ncbi:hypothetical protein HF086_018475 [Spodoptera exigua]|uniref:ATP-citrate synthase citrate-binding domain-containing protein n=1 Tax=Spodoptera exigua TaxID=7107 RepID=A0A922MU86_SPOEX|nr:hypothetical protein HF086_018475 [Spodoptera exigua]
MSSKAIYEATGKDLINRHIAPGTALVPCRFATFEQGTIWEDELGKNPWLAKESEEMYLNIMSGRRSDTILFHHQGGVDVGDVDALALRLEVLIIGGGIANFTNVADTFRGIITAIETYKDALIQQMREVGHRLRIPLYVFGPESNMTAIVGLALGQSPIPKEHQLDYAPKQLPKPQAAPKPKLDIPEMTHKLLDLVCSQAPTRQDLGQCPSSVMSLFTDRTKAIIWGMQNRAIQKLGIIRKPAAFISTICDERGNELSYCGVPISQVLERQMGVGGTISLLWFQRELPEWATKFFELVLIVTADHGPAVSGAHNTMVTARAGKDLISSVVSGLLTIVSSMTILFERKKNHLVANIRDM